MSSTLSTVKVKTEEKKPSKSNNEHTTPPNILQLYSQYSNYQLNSMSKEQNEGTSSKEHAESKNFALNQDSGSPIDSTTREIMESYFDFNFSDVRLHSDAKSSKIVEDLHADAFATGKDIYFRESNINTNPEKHNVLLAHELAHVVQQDGIQSSPQYHKPVIETGNEYEREANHAVHSIANGEKVSISHHVKPLSIQKGLFGDIVSGIGSGFKAATRAVARGARAVGGAVVSTAKAVGNVAVKAGSFLLEQASPVISDIKKTLKNAGDVIDIIIENPKGFLANLITGVKGGFSQFFGNIGTHLKNGLLGWLFGSLSDAGITLPETISLKSIAGLFLQVVGLTKDNIREEAVKIVGERNFAVFEKVWQYVTTLIQEGPQGLWDMMKEDLSGLISTAMEEIRNWIITQVIKQAAITLGSMFNPVSGFIKALMMIYDVIMFVKEKMQQIKEVVDSVISTVGAIARGNTQAMSNGIEQSLAKIVPVAIGFFASLAGLGGISGTIRGIIKKIQAPVKKIIRKVLKKIVGGFMKGAKKVGGAIKRFLFPEKKFNIGNESHKIWIKQSGNKLVPMVSSDPQMILEFISDLESNEDFDQTALKQAKNKVKEINKVLSKMDVSKESNEREKDSKTKKNFDKIIALETELSLLLQKAGLKSGTKVDDSTLKSMYKLEGLVSTYKGMPVAVADKLTPDHQPHAQLIIEAASTEAFEDTQLQEVAKTRVADGKAINLHHIRHTMGRTYGSPGGAIGRKVKTQFKGIDKDSSLSKVQKQNRIIRIAKENLVEDVTVIKHVVKTGKPHSKSSSKSKKDAYSDIKSSRKIPKKDKPGIIESIKNQIISGENKILNQSFNHWKKKK